MLRRPVGRDPMMPSGVRSVLRNFSYLFASQVLTIAIGACYSILLARQLGPVLYGTLNYGYAWYLTFIALTYLGLDMVLGREVGREPSAAPHLVGSTLVLRALAAAAIGIVSAVVAIVVEPQPEVRRLLYVLSVALFGRAVWLWCGSVFTAFEDTRHQFLIDLGFRPLELAAAIVTLLVVAPQSIIAVALVHAVVWWLQAAVGVATIVRRTRIEFGAVGGQARVLLLAGLPGALYTLAVIWFLQAPTVLFRYVVGTSRALGHFALAIQIVGYLVIVPYLIGNVALPVLARSAARADGKTRIAARATVITVPAATILLGVLALWLAPTMTVLIFGDRYVETGRIVAEAVWLLLPIGLAIGLQQIVFSHGCDPWTASLSSVLGVVAMAALYGPLTRALSYHGALIATGVGAALWAAGPLIALWRAGILSRRSAGAIGNGRAG